ncbi:MAG: ankyrin repeat domain-containing protein, partial [Bacteroidetes bacterium]
GQILREHLPSSRQVGTGYLIPSEGSAIEAALLIWTAETPRFFQEGDRVMLGPVGVPVLLRVAQAGQPLVRQIARLHALQKVTRAERFLLIPPALAPADMPAFLSGIKLRGLAEAYPHLIIPGQEAWVGTPGKWQRRVDTRQAEHSAMEWLLSQIWEAATRPAPSGAESVYELPQPAHSHAPQTMNREIPATPTATVSVPVRKTKAPKVDLPSLPAQEADAEGNYPLHRAILAHEPALLKQLLDQGANPGVKDRAGNQPLHLAAQANQISMAKALLAAGADPNARNFVYAAPLHLAVIHDHTEMVQLLIEQGAEVEARNNRSYTPLHKAAQTGNQAVAELLIACDADIHACMERDIQPLHLAAWYGHTALIELLIAHGANLNAANADGNTPLHFAAFNGQVKAIKTLINHEADPNRTNEQGETYLQGINEGYQGEMIRVLD